MEPTNDDDNVLQKPKEKKPRTAKQVEAFERAKKIRSENSKIKNEQIAEIKKSKPASNKKPTPTPAPAPAPVKQDTDSEEEQQVIIVKKKPKKKKKPIVIYDHESESESEEDQPLPPPKLKRQVAETIVPVPPVYHFKIVS